MAMTFFQPGEVEQIIASIAGQRYTQDSPILPEVWLRYAQGPNVPQDLLITPHWDARAGRVAQDIRQSVLAGRERKPRSREGDREPLRVAHFPGIVAANLYFDELLRQALTRTPWWYERFAELRTVLRVDQPDRALFPLDQTDLDNIAGRLPVRGVMARRTITPRNGIAADFLYVAVLGGAILMAQDATVQGKSTIASDNASRLTAFAALFADWTPDILADAYPDPDGKVQDAPLAVRRRFAWRVAINRLTEAAITRSTLAVKADATRRLFNVSCREITWAVVDSGIDAAHPAFVDWAAAPDPSGNRPSRVTRTYDFTRLRDLLDPAQIARATKRKMPAAQAELHKRLVLSLKALGVDNPEQEAPRQIRLLHDRLQNGLEIDWALLEPFLLVAQPEAPVEGHGTHVAGVLGADWRKPQAGVADPRSFEVRMQGVCPDIRLVDMRVLGEDALASEFEVVGSLQFIRYLNSRADSKVVHGANLSIATPHQVKSFACGSTPVCEECDRLWASGVVLVAAAGNTGFETYLLAGEKVLDGYNSASITDPGNAEGVITVGSTHRSEPHQYGVSFFSSRGPTGDGRRKPDLVAPGEKINGPLPNEGLGVGDGTSLAAPHVSGGAAMLMVRHTEMIGRPMKIKQILCDTATDLGRERYFQGAGMLDILRALQSI